MRYKTYLKTYRHLQNQLFEQAPLMNLAKDGQIFTFKHEGFWKPMDSLKDKNDLNKLWDNGKAPWKIW